MHYPDAETAAHMLAEEISAQQAALTEAEEAADICHMDGRLEGLRDAAWLLDVHKIVDAKLEDL